MKAGAFKLPLYKPPIVLNIAREDVCNLERFECGSALWMRLSGMEGNDDLKQIPCEPGYFKSYAVPEIHARAPRVTVEPQVDSLPKSLSITIHWVKGY